MFSEIQRAARALAEDFVFDNCIQVKAKALKMDSHITCDFFVCKDFLAVEKQHDYALRRYAGYEYISDAYIVELGNIVFYSTKDYRVSQHVSQVVEVAPFAVYDE